MSDLTPQGYKQVLARRDCSPPLIREGDEIVWLSDYGPEYGKVKWLGKLPDLGDHWMAGIHFDNPVGTGSGLYNNIQLFDAPPRHASLVPVIGLMKASDFLNF